jgi:aminoglycoside phosphotransferase (APT) family kinase protein
VSDLSDASLSRSAQPPEPAVRKVSGLDRIPGGASREDRLVLHYEQDGTRTRRLILPDPPGSLIDTERRLEFGAYAAFFRTPVPVPEAIWLEEDPAHLDYAFCVMQELPGLEASPAALLAPPYVQHRAKLGAHKWRILGEISRPTRRRSTRRVDADVAPAECWQRELATGKGCSTRTSSSRSP